MAKPTSNLPKCPWCKFWDDNRENQTKHFIQNHRSILLKSLTELGKPVNEANIRWMAGEFVFEAPV